MDKPDVDFIQGISPAIAIEQKTTARNPRSTVGTATEIYDYLRLLFARIGRTFCSKCGDEVKRDSVQSVVEALRARSNGEGELKLSVLFPLPDHPNASVREELENLKKQGYFRILYKGGLIDLGERTIDADIKKKDVLVLVDRLVCRPGSDDKRLADSVEMAFRAGDGSFKQLSRRELDIVRNGTEGFEGRRGFLKLGERKQYKSYSRMLLSRYRGYTLCESCGGARLRPEALCVKVASKSLFDVVRM